MRTRTSDLGGLFASDASMAAIVSPFVQLRRSMHGISCSTTKVSLTKSTISSFPSDQSGAWRRRVPIVFQHLLHSAQNKGRHMSPSTLDDRSDIFFSSENQITFDFHFQLRTITELPLRVPRTRIRLICSSKMYQHSPVGLTRYHQGSVA